MRAETFGEVIAERVAAWANFVTDDELIADIRQRSGGVSPSCTCRMGRTKHRWLIPLAGAWDAEPAGV
jgi:hypothetical protein